MEKTEELGSARTGFAAHCPHCRREQVFVRARVSNRKHFAVTILTMGLWSIVWMAVFLGSLLRPWRCSVCGWHKPEFRKTP